MDVFVGFDSAWADNPKAPGAICAVTWNGTCHSFQEPRLASFDKALAFIRGLRSTDGLTLVALDQPTIVPNATSMRPVERVAASVISWIGGGVQPSNRGKTGMFCDASPIWRFLKELGATEDPEAARTSRHGLYLMGVFPALALASLDSTFFGRLSGPRYNPGRRATFRIGDWKRVTEAAAREALAFDSGSVADWCRKAHLIAKPNKADQDRLDAVLCVLIAMRWRLRPRDESMLLGDRTNGYMVLPIQEAVRARLAIAAQKYAVPIDGSMP